ncbi:SHOCT domain-containing protein [Candidatus Pelagibacter sp.]|nr:SHOCT domain-containing protein [Candidatus Pelagibacter sp.]
MAKTKNIGNDISINIPNNYEYFELTFKQLSSRFPDIDYTDLDGWGIGIDSKIVVLANKKKSIRLFEDLTTVTGLAKLEGEFYEPLLELFENPALIKIVEKYVKKKFPNSDLDNLSEEELNILFYQGFADKKFMKKIDIHIRPLINKFNSKYEFDKITVILNLDKSSSIAEEINKISVADAKKISKDLIKQMIKESPKDPMVRELKSMKYKINKNHHGNLYLQSNWIGKDALQTAQELILTSHNDKFFFMVSSCYKKCQSTDFLDIIKPTDLYIQSKSVAKENENTTDIIDQLKSLKELMDSGVLTEDEFVKAKKKILN